MASDRITGVRLLFAILTLFLTISISRAVQITDVQRGVYAGYELLVVYCDSLGDARLYYDRVLGTCRIQISNAELTPRAFQQAQVLVASPFLDRFETDADRSTIVLKLRRPTYIRTYVVTGPSALMIDLSPAPEDSRQLPYELDMRGYLAEADFYEGSERYELALPYVEHVQSMNPDDPNYIHRAGILQHRMMRYNAALASFARLCDDPRYAADARARRAMIYLAVGDTVSSGLEWATHFHREPIDPPNARSSTDRPRNSGEAIASASAPLITPPPSASQARSFLKMGEDGFQIFGWLMLLISAVVLTRYIVLSRINRQAAAAAGHRHRYTYSDRQPSTGSAAPEDRRSASRYAAAPRPLDRPRSPFYRFSPSNWDLDARESRFYSRPAPVNPKPVDLPRYRGEYRFPDPPRDMSFEEDSASTIDDFKRPLTEPDTLDLTGFKTDAAKSTRFSSGSLSSKVADAYKRESESMTRTPDRPLKTPAAEEAGDKDSKIPVNKVLELAAQGGGELDIARKLGLGRDEVAMVLNLARLAHKGE